MHKMIGTPPCTLRQQWVSVHREKVGFTWVQKYHLIVNNNSSDSSDSCDISDSSKIIETNDSSKRSDSYEKNVWWKKNCDWK